MAGAVWALRLTGTPVDFIGIIGLIILVGVVVNNGIVLIDKIHRLRLEGMDRDRAVLEGASARVRPILMTALTTVFGLLPMALSNAPTQGIDYKALATCVARAWGSSLICVDLCPSAANLPRQTMTTSTRTTTLTALAISLLWAGVAAAQICLTPLAPDEPLCNPALADAPWPITHRGAYAQGSSPLPGPLGSETITAQHLNLTGIPTTVAIGPQYADGGRAVWASVVGLNGAIYKLDHDTFSIIDVYIPADEEDMPPEIPLAVGGAYSVLSAESDFILGRGDYVEVYRDRVSGGRFSEIELAKRLFLPRRAFCRDTDLLVGGVMLPDGMLAFVTEQAAVGVVPSRVEDMEVGNVVTLPSENGAACDDPSIPDDELETVSNNLAADEYGNFYVVTDRAVIKYSWNGTSLEKVWRAAYPSDPPISFLRLGPGSGSTPSLMGTAIDDDRFVVITDGRELMHLLLIWRDDVPEDWEAISPELDRRIACAVPVTFGDPQAERSLSEQSVLVRGRSAIVVNNLLADESELETPVPALDVALAALAGGDPSLAPRGLQRIDWDPVTRTCATVWTNTEVSMPNAIPTMSATSELIYAIGQRDGVWGLEAIELDTGASRFFQPSSQTACPQEVLDLIADTFLAPILLPALERLPASCENSFFAATEVGPDATIYTGTFQGVSKFSPDSQPAAAYRPQVDAGIAQGQDLAERALRAMPNNTVRAKEALDRSLLQLTATQGAIGEAERSGEIGPRQAEDASSEVASAREHFSNAATLVESQPATATDEIEQAQRDLERAANALDDRPSDGDPDDDGCAIVAPAPQRLAWVLLLSVLLGVVGRRSRSSRRRT